MSKQNHKQFQKLFYQKFPKHGKSIELYANTMFSMLDYGFYNEEIEAPKHCNFIAKYNETGRYRRRTKSDILIHFLAQDKAFNDYLWYTSNIVYRSEKRIIACVLDFDNKECISGFKEVVLSQLSDLSELKDRWTNSSTKGYGLHMHVHFDVGNLDAWDVCEKLNELQRLLKSAIKHFDCVRGHPIRKTSKNIDYAGTLALAPRLASDEDAAAFFASLEAIDLCKLCEKLQERSTGAVCNTAMLNCRKPIDIAPKEETLTHSKEMELKKPYPSAGEEIHNKSPNQRMIYAVQVFARENKRLPSIIEAVLFYEHLHLHTGRDKNRRVKRAEHAIEFVGRTFDVEKIGSNKKIIPFSIQDAEELFARIAIHPDDLVYAEGKRLRIEQVCSFAVYFTQLMTLRHNENKNLDGTVSQEQVKRHLKLNGQQYSRLKHIMNDYDVIKTLSHSYRVGGPGGGISKKYCFGNNHPLYRG